MGDRQKIDQLNCSNEYRQIVRRIVDLLKEDFPPCAIINNEPDGSISVAYEEPKDTYASGENPFQINAASTYLRLYENGRVDFCSAGDGGDSNCVAARLKSRRTTKKAFVEAELAIRQHSIDSLSSILSVIKKHPTSFNRYSGDLHSNSAAQKPAQEKNGGLNAALPTTCTPEHQHFIHSISTTLGYKIPPCAEITFDEKGSIRATFQNPFRTFFSNSAIADLILPDTQLTFQPSGYVDTCTIRKGFPPECNAGGKRSSYRLYRMKTNQSVSQNGYVDQHEDDNGDIVNTFKEVKGLVALRSLDQRILENMTSDDMNHPKQTTTQPRKKKYAARKNLALQGKAPITTGGEKKNQTPVKTPTTAQSTSTKMQRETLYNDESSRTNHYLLEAPKWDSRSWQERTQHLYQPPPPKTKEMKCRYVNERVWVKKKADKTVYRDYYRCKYENDAYGRQVERCGFEKRSELQPTYEDELDIRPILRCGME